MNRVQIKGNLGAKPTFANSQNGHEVCNLSVCTHEYSKEETISEWHKVTVWDKNSIQKIKEFADKGSLVLVEGKLKTEEWTDNKGVKHHTTKIIAQFPKGYVEVLHSKIKQTSNITHNLNERENAYSDIGYNKNNNSEMDDMPF